MFKGWHEGRICFPPTYKYSMNSNVYTLEVVASKETRRNPAWYVRHPSVKLAKICTLFNYSKLWRVLPPKDVAALENDWL